MARSKRSGSKGARALKATPIRVDEHLDPQARLAVNLPILTHRQLKARAAEEGSSIRDYILDMLRKNGIG